MPNRPNILFLLSDEHSFRFLSARSPERDGEPCRTPTLDRLIQQGVHFETAYCQMPLCTPSRMSMLSGRHSHRCPVLWPDTPTFASHLGQHGYATAAVGKMHLQGSRQYAGFGARPYGDFNAPSPGHQKDPLFLPGVQDHIFMPSIIEDAGLSDIPESLLQEQFVVREATAWLREHRHAHPNQPWLMYTSFVHPHFPMNAPRRFFERYYPEGVTPPKVGRNGDAQNHPMTLEALRSDSGESQGHPAEEITAEQTLRARAAYAACVDQLDEIIGDFLAVLERDGLLDNTVIVYTSDHGELAGEHGLWWKQTWHEASTRVPLIVSLPEHRQGQLSSAEVTAPVSLADIFPTLCGLTGTPLIEDLDGIDLTAAVRGDACSALAARPGVIVENLGKGYRMIRSPRYKYIACHTYEDLAFDLIDDPDEQRNLAGRAAGETAAELEELKSVLFDGFDFAEAIEATRRESAQYHRQYPSRIKPRTSNQIMRGDGMLVEADQPLYYPDVVSEDPRRDFSDCPQQRRASRRRR